MRRFELSLKEEDIIQISKRSDRGLSIDEGPELADSIGAAVGSVDNNHQSDSQTEHDEMKLKKTTVLTGNHAALKQRNRA